MKRILIVVLLLIVSNITFGQNKEVKVKVVNPSGNLVDWDIPAEKTVYIDNQKVGTIQQDYSDWLLPPIDGSENYKFKPTNNNSIYKNNNNLFDNNVNVIEYNSPYRVVKPQKVDTNKEFFDSIKKSLGHDN